MTKRKATAAIYVRISRDADGRAAGVERQEADCRALAERMGLTLYPRVFKDNDTGASSKSKKARPAFSELLEAVKAGEVNVILAYSNSRITRRPLEWESLIRLSETHGLQVHTVVSSSAQFDTADGRMVLRVLAANDAAEADRISERVTRAKQQRLEEGAFRGGPRPFGYEADGMTIRETEAQALREAAGRIVAGESLRSVTADLRDRGFKGTRRADSGLQPVQLRRILLRPRNAGLVEHYGKVTGPAAWPAILSEDEWQAVRSILTDPARKTNHGSNRVKHLGSNLFRCGVCGDHVRASAASRGYRVYRCKTGAHVSRAQEPIDHFIREVMAARLRADPDVLRREDDADDTAPNAIRRELSTLRARRAQLADDYADGLLDGPQVKAAGARIDAKIEAAAAELARLTADSAMARVTEADDAGQAFLDAPIGAQRAILDALATVTIFPAGKKGRPRGWSTGQPYLDVESVRIDWKGEDDD